MAQRWTRIWEGSGATTLAERMVCPLWAAVLGNGTQVDADNRMFTNPLTGEPDAGNPHVRFGGRGKVNPLSLPYPAWRPVHGPDARPLLDVEATHEPRDRLQGPRGLVQSFITRRRNASWRKTSILFRKASMTAEWAV